MKKVKEWVFDQNNPNANFYDIWENIGAFAGKDESRNLAFTKKTEELAAYISVAYMSDSALMSNIVFAIVVRSYYVYDYIFESCSGVIMFINNHKYMIAEIAAGGPEIDAEAEFCAKMAESIYKLKI